MLMLQEMSWIYSKKSARNVNWKSKGIVVKPLLSKDFSVEDKVDLVDMQSMRDGDSLHYQDHLQFNRLQCNRAK